MSYKLTYFPIRGRAETSRLVMMAAKKSFNDNRIGNADWPSIKPTTPFGNVPVLELNGEQFAQGMAIATFFARETGLYGKTNLDGLKIDQIHHLREELIVEEIKVFKEQDAKKKEEMTQVLNSQVYPRIVGNFNRLIEENQKANNGSEFAVGNSLSLADIVIFEGTTSLSQTNPDLLNKYGAVVALRKKVAGQDGIKQYLEKRASTPL